MITSAFNLTATERVLPKLALDFTTANLDSRITFTRTTDATHPATYINSSGYVTAATDNQPRFDYDPVTLACKGLLIEESRTNLCTTSETFTDWSLNSVLLANETITNPANTSGCVSISGNGLAATHGIARSWSASATGKSVSFFAKYKDCRFIQIWFDGDATLRVNFDLVSGTISSTSGSVTAKITAYANGWYRCICETTSTTATVPRIYLISSGSSGRNENWTTSTGVYLWGGQMEAASFATSYIPTTSAALTRNADVATMTGTNFSDWWTATTGSASVNATQKTISGTRPLFQVDDNTTSNQICLRGNGANPELYIKATTDQAQIDAGTIVANTAYKLAGSWNTNSCAAAQNGASAVTDSSATIPTVTQARIGCDGTNYANSWIASINYWPQRITDSETQAFSK